MSRSDRYNTKQKDLILDVIKSQRTRFTIKDIYNEIKSMVGLTTIYRLVDNLLKDGSLKKFIEKDNTTYYQYLEECSEKNHFYLKCESCGKMIHVDCECIETLSKHIYKKHNFSPSQKQIIINGLCDRCSLKGE